MDFEAIKRAAEGYRADMSRFLRDMIAIGEEFHARWLCAGKRSKKGHPHHPLYLRKDEQVQPFPVKAYLESL